MKNSNAFDKALDALIEEAAQMAAEAEGRALDIEYPEVSFSPEHEKRMKKLFKKERRKLTLRKITKLSKIAACFLLAVTTLGSVCILSVEAWRERAMNFIEDISGKYSSVDFGNENSYYGENGVVIGYLPEGFELTADNSSEYNTNLVFQGNDYYYIFSAVNLNTERKFDTEDAKVEYTTVNGHNAIFISKDGEYTLVWSDNNFSYYIGANIPKEMIFKIAESVRVSK